MDAHAESPVANAGPAASAMPQRLRSIDELPGPRGWPFVGNLPQVLERCPNATLLVTSFMVERMATESMLPLDRMRWVNEEDTIRVGDRELVAVVPPTYDSPTTRGLFDTSSGVYWAGDSFGVPLPFQVDSIRELPPGFFREGFLEMQRMLSPWHRWLDPVRYGLDAVILARAGLHRVKSGLKGALGRGGPGHS